MLLVEHERGLQADRERVADGGRAREVDDTRRPAGVGEHEPSPLGSGHLRTDRRRRGSAQVLESPPQHRRSEERRQEHDEQDRRVVALPDDRLAESDRREDQSDLAAGHHPDSYEQSVAGSTQQTGSRSQLAHDRDHEQHRGEAEHRRLRELGDIDVDADRAGRTPG